MSDGLYIKSKTIANPFAKSVKGESYSSVRLVAKLQIGPPDVVPGYDLSVEFKDMNAGMVVTGVSTDDKPDVAAAVAADMLGLSSPEAARNLTEEQARDMIERFEIMAPNAS